MNTVDKNLVINTFFKAQLPAGAFTQLPELPALIESSVVVHARAGEAIFHENLPHPYYYILVQGCAKMVYVRTDGRQWIKSFLVTGDGFASLTALIPDGRTSYSTYAIAPCILVKMNFSLMQQLGRKHLLWANLIAGVAMQYAGIKEARERDLLTLSPEQRLLKVIQDQPAWLAIVTQTDLAKYIGISAVGLNRILKRLKAEEASPLDRLRLKFRGP
jgi:CRP-like cAMP-binding protein